MKSLNLEKNILALTDQYPELVEILKNIGFTEIANPVMRKTAGRVMTLPKGCEMKGIPLDSVKKELEAQGFLIEGKDDSNE